MINNLILYAGHIDSVLKVVVVIINIYLSFHVIPKVTARMEVKRAIRQRRQIREVRERIYKRRYRQTQFIALLANMIVIGSISF